MLEIKNLCKRYGQTQALDNVQLSVGPGELVEYGSCIMTIG